MHQILPLMEHAGLQCERIMTMKMKESTKDDKYLIPVVLKVQLRLAFQKMNLFNLDFINPLISSY